jgi:hypothetical protein
MKPIFLLDGKAYNVRVLSLTRKFAITETGISGRTQDGQMYRDLFGTYYNYSMTVAQRGEDAASLDAFWQAVSDPKISHLCVFPYGQKTLTQRMYVKAGKQALDRRQAGKNHWAQLELAFIAMAPVVRP